MIAAVLYFLYLASVCESLRFPTNSRRIDRTSNHLPTFVREKQLFSSESGNDEEEPSFIRQQLKTHFKKTMQTSNVPLLEKFETYLNSLPVRKWNSRDYIRLCDYDYIVDPEDMKTMVNQIIEELPDYVRDVVRYISAPTGSGKTSSVLPAFLESTSMTRGGTHYLYLAFDNNKKRKFTFVLDTPSNIKIEAELQGAAFMVQCVKNLLERSDDIKAYKITIPSVHELKDGVDDYVKELQEYLHEKLGQDCRVWFHLDEHRKMCNRDSNPICGAAFSRGAMSVLAMLNNQTVIATYIDLPNLPPLGGSSGLCRKGIALPPLDVNRVTSGLVPELLINSDVNEEKDSTLKNRLLATLKVRLGFSIRPKIIGILHKPGTSEIVNNFLHNFQSAMKGTDRVKALKDCITLCSFPVSTDSYPDQNAAQLLIGADDSNDSKSDWIKERRFSDILVLPDGTISLSVMQLLRLTDPGFPVFLTGRDLFAKFLTDTADEPDLLSSSPLEASYYWTISCRSAVRNLIKFHKSNYLIKCTDLQPGRLFPDTNSSIYDLSVLKPSVMYYADERGGLPTHPLADLFFVTTDNELVLVDIAGGSIDAAKEKKKKLTSWIEQESNNITQYTVKGVVLAPNANRNSTTEKNITMVCGEEAIDLLGGFGQIRRWMT